MTSKSSDGSRNVVSPLPPESPPADGERTLSAEKLARAVLAYDGTLVGWTAGGDVEVDEAIWARLVQLARQALK